MSPLCPRVPATALRRRVDAGTLGFASTEELVGQPLPWIGQTRAEAAARFGLGMAMPGYNLWVVGEVGSGRTTLMRQLMRQQAQALPTPPDLCYLHHVEQPEQLLALRLPAGQGRQLRQRMQQFARWLQAEIPRRLGEADVKAEGRRIEQVYKSEEARAYGELNLLAQTLHFSLMRDQGHLVFAAHDEQGEPLTAGKAMALSPAQRAEIDRREATLREEIARFLEKTRAMERVMNEGLATSRSSCAPMFSSGSSSSTALATSTPELTICGGPNSRARITVRPRGPMVTWTAWASASTPRRILSCAASRKSRGRAFMGRTLRQMVSRQCPWPRTHAMCVGARLGRAISDQSSRSLTTPSWSSLNLEFVDFAAGRVGQVRELDHGGRDFLRRRGIVFRDLVQAADVGVDFFHGGALLFHGR